MKVIEACMLDSILPARWLEQFSKQEVDFLLIPGSPNLRIHPQLQPMLQRNTIGNYKIVALGRWFDLPLWMLDKFTNNFFGGSLRSWTIKKHKHEFARCPRALKYRLCESHGAGKTKAR